MFFCGKFFSIRSSKLIFIFYKDRDKLLNNIQIINLASLAVFKINSFTNH